MGWCLNLVHISHIHAVVILGCPGPCHRQTGKVELSSTLPVCRQCFRALLEDWQWFFQCKFLSAADADTPASFESCARSKLDGNGAQNWCLLLDISSLPQCLRHVWGLTATHLELVCDTTWVTANVLPHMWTRLNPGLKFYLISIFPDRRGTLLQVSLIFSAGPSLGRKWQSTTQRQAYSYRQVRGFF